MAYQPKQGDIIVIDFDPQAGHEQSGRRPCLVVSNDQYHLRTKLAMVCPITNTISEFPMHILLDKRTRTTGEIMCEQVKCLDIIARNPSHKETITEDLLDEVIDMICSFVE